jgi:MscS family membrane protein
MLNFILHLLIVTTICAILFQKERVTFASKLPYPNLLQLPILWMFVWLFFILNNTSVYVKDFDPSLFSLTNTYSGILLTLFITIALLSIFHYTRKKTTAEEIQSESYWWTKHWTLMSLSQLGGIILFSGSLLTLFLTQHYTATDLPPHQLSFQGLFDVIQDQAILTRIILTGSGFVPEEVFYVLNGIVWSAVSLLWGISYASKLIKRNFTLSENFRIFLKDVTVILRYTIAAYVIFNTFRLIKPDASNSFVNILPEIFRLNTIEALIYSFFKIYLFYIIYRYAETIISQTLYKTYTSKEQKSLIYGVQRLMKLIAILVAILIMMNEYGYSSAALTSSALIGTAIAFASRVFVENLIGGLALFLTRPFTKGDWIKSTNKKFEGTVEEIGWYYTQIRTFERRPTFIPNSLLGDAIVENPGRMYNRRIKTDISVRYSDIDKVVLITDEIRDYLYKHPLIDTSQTILVNFTEFATHSVDINIYCFTKTTVWKDWRDYRQGIYLDIANIIKKHGADFAYPTQTLNIEKK